MKRFLFFVFIIILVCITFGALSDGTLSWGISQEDTISIMGQPSNTDIPDRVGMDIIAYTDQSIGNANGATLALSFKQNSLFSRQYVFDNDVGQNRYSYIENALNHLYGEQDFNVSVATQYFQFYVSLDYTDEKSQARIKSTNSSCRTWIVDDTNILLLYTPKTTILCYTLIDSLIPKDEDNFDAFSVSGSGNIKPQNTITDLSIKAQSNGIATVTWKSSSNGPFTVSQKISGRDSGISFETNEKSYSLIYLVPGVKYEIEVSDNISSAKEDITIRKGTFTAFKTYEPVTVQPSKISVSKNYYSTIKVTTNYPEVNNGKSYNRIMAIKTPNGYSLYAFSSAFIIETRFSGKYNTVDMGEVFDWLKEEFGSIPKGEYVFEIYFDGDLYGSNSLYVY